MSIILWGLVIAVVVGIILFIWRPEFVRAPGSTNTVDFTRLIIVSLVAGLIASLLVWLIRGLR